MSNHPDAAIRQIRASDQAALTQFFVENNRPEITTHFHPFPLTSTSALRIATAPGLDRHYVALLNGQIVGFCMLRGWEEGYEVPSFGVMIDYRRQGLGLGRQMTAAMIEQARGLGCPAVRLTVYASNERAVRLYESLGFGELRREPVTIAGRMDEKIMMLKELKV